MQQGFGLSRMPTLERETFSIQRVSFQMTQRALTQMATDVSTATFLLPIFLAFVANDTPHIDSIALITTYSNTVVMVSTSLLFSIKIDVSKLYPELHQVAERSDEWEEKRLAIVDLLRYGVSISSVVLPLSVLLFVFSGGILSGVFKQNLQIAYYAQDFLRNYATNLPALIYGNCFRQLIYGFSAQQPQQVGFGFVALGLISAGLLARYKVLGTDGIILGYAVSQYGAALTYGYYLLFHQQYKHLKLLDSVLHWPEKNQGTMVQQLVASLPIFFINVSETVFIFCLSVMAGFINPESQAAFALMMQYISINFWIGTNVAMSSLFVMNQLRSNPSKQHLIAPTAVNGIILTAVASAVLPTFFAGYPQALMVLFGANDPQILQILTRVTPWMSVGSLLDSTYYAPMLQLRALNDVQGVLLTRIPSVALGILLSIVLVFETTLGVESIGGAYCLAMALSLVGVLGRWKEKMQPYTTAYQQDRDNPLRPSETDAATTQSRAAPPSRYRHHTFFRGVCSEEGALELGLAPQDKALELVARGHGTH